MAKVVDSKQQAQNSILKSQISSFRLKIDHLKLEILLHKHKINSLRTKSGINKPSQAYNQPCML